MKTSVVLIVVFLSVTALATWHASQQPASGGLAPTPVVSSAAAGWLPQHPSQRWECIVIHHSATEVGGAERFDRAHREKGWDQLGYHFVIGNGSDTADGLVEVGPRWTAQKHGAHCFTPGEYYNDHGIGICLVGNLDNHPPSAQQIRSLRRLVRFLCHQYGISADHIRTHGDVTGKTRCPGGQFDLESIRAAVAR